MQIGCGCKFTTANFAAVCCASRRDAAGLGLLCQTLGVSPLSSTPRPKHNSGTSSQHATVLPTHFDFTLYFTLPAVTLEGQGSSVRKRNPDFCQSRKLAIQLCHSTAGRRGKHRQLSFVASARMRSSQSSCRWWTALRFRLQRRAGNVSTPR